MTDENIYFILLAKYMNKYSLQDEIQVFPMYNFNIDFETKIKILVEALNDDIVVDATKEYQKYLEKINFDRPNEFIK